MKRRKKAVSVKHRASRPDFGKANDLLFYGSSSYGYYNAWTKEQCLSCYNDSMARRNSSYSDKITPSSFVDTISTYTDRGKVMNNCDHTKQRVINSPYLLIFDNYNSNGKYNLYPYFRSRVYPVYWVDAVTTASRLASFNDQMFSARAYWSMRPKLESSVSLINSIFELKDFKDVAQFMFSPNGAARSIAQGMRSLKSLNRAIGGGNSHKFKSPLPSIVKAIRALDDYVRSASVSTHTDNLITSVSSAAANGILTANLAIMPTIRDVAAIHGEMQKDVYDQLLQFKQLGDVGARSHFSETEKVLSNITTGYNNEYIDGTGKQIHLTRTATMVSKYQILWKRFEDMYPKWWGLELGADEVWNMLPLSFVLDYVMTIGKSLEYMDVDKRINVLGVEYCESVKVIAELGYYIAQSHRTPHVIIDGKYITPSKQKYLLVSGTRGSCYRRVVMEPYKGPALPKLRLPSGKQAANILALARCLLF